MWNRRTYIGPRDATPIILNGLKRLEYRGYDSAGLAVLNGDRLEVRKDAGKLSQLIDLVYKSPINGAPGIGNTRWATHGAPEGLPLICRFSYPTQALPWKGREQDS